MAFNAKEHMSKLSGKDYLEVKWRLVWFREEHPDYSIMTELVNHTDSSAIFKAEIAEPITGNVISTGYGSETAKDFKDFLEKAETKAVGRALAMLGYGTQFAPELEEGERIVDSPVERPVTNAQEAAAVVLTFGKYKGKTLGELFRSDKGYLDYLYNGEKTDPKIKTALQLMKDAVNAQHGN